MNFTAFEFVLERAHHLLMLFDAAKPGERLGSDEHLVVVAPTGQVGHINLAAGEKLVQPCAHLVR